MTIYTDVILINITTSASAKVHYSTIAAHCKELEKRIIRLKRLKGLLVKSKPIKLIGTLILSFGQHVFLPL